MKRRSAPGSDAAIGAGSDVRPFSSFSTSAMPLTVDLWRFRLEAVLPPFDRDQYRRQRRTFHDLGLLARPQDERAIDLRLPIVLPDGRHAGFVSADLTLRHVESGGFVLTGDISGNGHLSLRVLLGDDRAGPADLQKRGNVVGPTGSLAPHDVRDCVASISAGVATAITATSTLTGCDIAGLASATLRSSALELTHDYRKPGAIAVAQRATRGSFDASAASLRSLGIEQLMTGDEEARAWLRVRTAKRGSDLKMYAKLADLLRLEWVLDRRGDVSAALSVLVGHPGDNPADLISGAFELAAAELAEFKLWIDEVGHGTASNIDLIIALKPLVDLCRSTEKRRGRAPAKAVADQAKAILTSLLTTGRALTPGLKDGPLKRELTGLVTAGVLVTGRGHRVAFGVAPQFVSGLDLRISGAS